MLLEVAAALDRLGVEYLLGGSLASSVLGEPRATVDRGRLDLAYLRCWFAALGVGDLLERALEESDPG